MGDHLQMGSGKVPSVLYDKEVYFLSVVVFVVFLQPNLVPVKRPLPSKIGNEFFFFSKLEINLFIIRYELCFLPVLKSGFVFYLLFAFY